VSPSSQDAHGNNQEASFPKRARTTTSPRNKTRPSPPSQSASDTKVGLDSTTVAAHYPERSAMVMHRPTTASAVPQATQGAPSSLHYVFPTQNHQHVQKRTVYDARLQSTSTGLNSTLGRRNSSAIELFGGYRPQVSSSQVLAPSPQAQHIHTSNGLFQSASSEGNWSSFRPPSTAISPEIHFNVPPTTLAGLPWGLLPSGAPPTAPSSDGQPVQYVQLEVRFYRSVTGQLY
jgi:hypothetical protein